MKPMTSSSELESSHSRRPRAFAHLGRTTRSRSATATACAAAHEAGRDQHEVDDERGAHGLRAFLPGGAADVRPEADQEEQFVTGIQLT